MSGKRKTRIKGDAKRVSIESPQPSGPTISLCMMVRNEERFLPGCLDSIRKYVDEIIIVDTGSTDRSIQIAKRYGAKVFEHPWENNFAKHRNQTISYAEGDWIFILDADEELVAPSGINLRKAIQDETIDSIAVQVINPFNNGKNSAVFNSIRLFRNNVGIKYEGIVHNKEVGCKRTKFYPFQIFHHGYNLDEQDLHAKFERTTALLKAQISKDQDNPLPHHYLAVSYLSMGDYNPEYYSKAIEEGTIAIELAIKRHEDDPIYLSTHYTVAASHSNLGNTDRAETFCKKALEIFPQHLDSYYLLAKIYDRTGNYPEASRCAEGYLSIRDKIERHPEQFGKIVNNSFGAEWLINIIRGKAAYEQGAYKEAKDVFKDVVEKGNCNQEIYKLIGEFYIRKMAYMEAEYYLKEANKIEKDKIVLYMLCECYGQAGNIERQVSILSEILEFFPEELSNFKQIGLTQLERANYRLASFCLGRVVGSGDVSKEIVEKLETANSMLEKRENHKKRPISDRTTISACLMVKDEEHCLENCLKSVKPFVDEIIIVDTGSTDGTIAIAEKYGAKVYHHLWEGDFSKHRNQSMLYARSDWMLVIDADESLDPGSGESMRAIAQETPKNAVLFKVINCSSRGGASSLFISPRLFRNNVGCHYRGIVHNQPHYPGDPEGSVLQIYHYGYDLPLEQMKAKGKRTIELLEKQMKMTPDALFPRFNLAISKFICGDFQSSVKEGEKVIQLIQRYGITDRGYAGIYYIVSAAYYYLRMLDQSKEAALQGLTYDPGNLDALCILTAIYEQFQDYPKAIESGERYLVLHQKIIQTKAIQNADYKTFGNRWNVLLTLSYAYHQKQQQEKARKYFYEAANSVPIEIFPPRERAKFCLKIEEYDSALTYLKTVSGNAIIKK